VDGAGKATQTKLLAAALAEPVVYDFPQYTGAFGPLIKSTMDMGYDDPWVDRIRALLMAADRDDVAGDIERYLADGTDVICNRYSPSNLVYGSALGLGQDWCEALDAYLPQPDLVIVLVTDKPHRHKPRDDFERDGRLMRRVNALYMEYAREFGWVLINADQSKDKVHELIKHQVMPLLTAA
jgi:dTMP kinase